MRVGRDCRDVPAGETEALLGRIAGGMSAAGALVTV
jgi:hypothetical protein